jgi:hypothetical protein
MQFDHIIHPVVKAVLCGETESPSDIWQAAYLTESAMAEDWKSNLVLLEVMEAREGFAGAMEACIVAGDMPGAISAMRGFWSI